MDFMINIKAHYTFLHSLHSTNPNKGNPARPSTAHSYMKSDTISRHEVKISDVGMFVS